MDTSAFFQFGLYGLLGLVISQIGDVYSSGIKLTEFNGKKWVDDNLLQMVLSMLCISALLLLGGSVFESITGTKLNSQTVFWAGLGSDAITNYFVRRAKHTKEP